MDEIMFATLEDLEERFSGELSADDKKRAAVLLGDASVMLIGLGLNPDRMTRVDFLNAKRICCEMVTRALNVSDNMYGMTQFSQTAGPYTMSFTPSNSSGEMYLTKTEKQTLGLGRARVHTIAPMIGPRDVY